MLTLGGNLLGIHRRDERHDLPSRRQANEDVDDPKQDRTGAKDGGNQVEPKEPDRAQLSPPTVTRKSVTMFSVLIMVS